MGLCGSSATAEVTREFPRTLQTLGLQDKADAFVHIFQTIDLDGSGRVGMIELLTFLDLPRTPFLERTFGIFDNDGTMTLDFREMVVCLYHFCTLDQKGLGGFMFDLYDTDMSRRITKRELLAALRDTYGSGASSEIRFQSLLRRLDKLDGHAVSRDEFSDLCVRMSEMLYPAVQAQQQVRRKILGVRYWEKLTEQRSHRPHVFLPENWRLLQRRVVEVDLEVRAREERAKLQESAGGAAVHPIESQEDREAIAALEAEERALATGRAYSGGKVEGEGEAGPKLDIALM